MFTLPKRPEDVLLKTIAVEVQSDHLERLAQARPMKAMAELIWNALDADAQRVKVCFEENALGGMTAIRVDDDGQGIAYDQAMTAFKNLGGSWKKEAGVSAGHRRRLHGRYGKGRFRAFSLGDRARWVTSFACGNGVDSYAIAGTLAELGTFTVSDPERSTENGAPGTSLTIENPPPRAEALRGERALEEVTDIFALYLRQYPQVRIVYDGVPLDPANAEDRSETVLLDDMVLERGDTVSIALTLVEWRTPGRSGVVLCDAEGFGLHRVSPRLRFRGYSYTAFLKSKCFSWLDQEGMLEIQDLSGDVRQILAEARQAIRHYFYRREQERCVDTVKRWQQEEVYPYDEAENGESNRAIFDVFAGHLGTMDSIHDAPKAHRYLMLHLLKEVIEARPERAARVFDGVLTVPEEQEQAVLSLLDR